LQRSSSFTVCLQRPGPNVHREHSGVGRGEWLIGISFGNLAGRRGQLSP
jgi:hypothetical protein